MTNAVQDTPTVDTNSRTRETFTLKRRYGTLYVDDWQPVLPSGQPPVLLVHGWGGTGTYWQDTAIALSRSVRVLVPDLPGTGRSQPVNTARNMFDQVDTLADILDAFELDQVQLVGHSMGGAMSVLLAARHPERVERLVLTSLTFFKNERQKQIYRNVMRGFKVSMRFRTKLLASVPGTTNMMAKQYFHRVPKDNPMLQRGLLDFLELDAGTAIASADDATDDAIPEAGALLQMPVLLVACRQDKMMPMENVAFTEDIIPDCRVRWIEECGHLPMVEKTTEYLSILQDFLRL